MLIADYTLLLGCEKLGIHNYRCKVVLEEDGSEIDDDEALKGFQGSALMILQPDEDWSCALQQNKQTAAKHKTADEGN